ncbi:unnamed protein product, partial [Mesorhabditis belari]|uniref:MAP kinase-activating death domain protein n=1 Tax=Mesorhabditis belari TaxID=2138241 RepID=A0AAF3FR35_9BILA
MDDKGKELCPRLIDYLVVVGKRAKQRSTSIIGTDGQQTANVHTVSYPELLRRYPTDDHKDFYLPTDVTVFCQPEGCPTINYSNRERRAKDSQFFVFMLTEKDTSRIRFGVCLNFFQCCERRTADGVSGKTKKKDHLISLTSLCLISHHPFVSIFHELLIILKNIIDACNHRVSKATNQKEIVWSVLTGSWHDTIPVEVMKEIKQIETWILMLLSSPVPVPARTKVQLEILPMDLCPMFSFALPDHTRFSLVDFPLHLPFELLGIEGTVKVLSAVMLEYKVVLQSRNYNAVSMCVLSLVALLYPLEYMFPVIPLLPAYMQSAEHLLLAPTPFIIGVPSSFWAHKKLQEIPSDIIVVDLDACQVHVPEELTLPELPEPDVGDLKMNVRMALNRMNTNLVDERRGSVEANYSTDADEVDVACRVAMIKFYNSTNIFANFSEHTRTLRLYPRPVVALQSESFLRSRPNCTQFVMDLCRTQAVEYFAEECLCPRNETFVRVQNGIDKPQQVGDKAKWFADSLMPVHFMVYPDNSTLAPAIDTWRREGDGDESDEELSDDGEERPGSTSSIDDLVFDSPDEVTDRTIASKPLGEVNDVYKEPLNLEIPPSETVASFGSSVSSGHSSPSSSRSASALDSEADFARLAENLALKSDAKGAFSFDHEDDDAESTPIQNRRKTLQSEANTENNTPTTKTPLSNKGKLKLTSLTDSSQNFMSGFNGLAEKSSDIFSQMLTKTGGLKQAQALRDKTVKPLAAAAASRIEQSQHAVKTKTQGTPTSTQTANQQSKNQQTVREVCDAILAGQGIGMFAYPKFKRLMEDESLRELVCSKLNLGLENRLTEEEFVKEFQLTRAQYKGYVKVLQACLAGIELSFNTPGSNGLASVFHILEIAHTHFWSRDDGVMTPASGGNSQLPTPSASVQDLQSIQPRQKLPATSYDMRSMPKPIGKLSNGEPIQGPSTAQPTQSLQSEKKPTVVPFGIPGNDPLPKQTIPQPTPPPIPPRDGVAAHPHPPPLPARPQMDVSQASDASIPPLPPRPPPPRQESIQENSKLARGSSSESGGSQRPLQEKLKAPSTLPVSASGTPSTRSIVTPIEPRHFIYQDLILPNQHPLWQNMVFWENAFYDVVGQERDIIGMDQEPSEMIDRYSTLSESERKRLELEEDRLLATLLHNLTAYMMMCGTGQKASQQKIRRLLGKAHIGLVCSKTINQLLDELPQQQGNAIPLKPLGSRLVQKQSFTVYAGSNAQGMMLFMEVCDDAVVLRAVTGAITERWWYERLVNMTYSPKTKVLCLWRRHEDKVHMHKFYTKKCRELYLCMKAAMERAAARGRVSVEGRDLGGEFPVHDTETNQGGLMQVRIDGIAILFESSQHFIELGNIKKCNTFGGNCFVLEEFDRKKNELVQRRYFSQMAPSIAWCLHRVFSKKMVHSSPIICNDSKGVKPKKGPRTPPGTPPSSSSSEKKSPMPSSSPKSSEEKQQSALGYKPSRWDISPALSVRSSESPGKTPMFGDVSTISSLCVSPVTEQYEMVSSSSLGSPSPPPWRGGRRSRSRSPREHRSRSRSPRVHRSRSRSPRRKYRSRSTSPLMVYLPSSRHGTSPVDHSRNYRSYRTSAQRTPSAPHTSRRDQLPYVQYVEKKSQWNTFGKVENRQHSVSPLCQRRQGSPNRQIGLFNLPYNVSENDLREIYRRHGPIEDIRIIFDYETGMSRGFAFITFNHLRDATKALQATKGMKIDDRMIKADYALGENVGHTSNSKYLLQDRRVHHINDRVSYTDGVSMPQISASVLRKKVKLKRRSTRIKTPSLSPPKRACLTKLMRDASLSMPSEKESGDAPRRARAHSWTTVTPPSSPDRGKDDDDFKTPSTIYSSAESQLEPPTRTPPETPKKISFKLKWTVIKSSKTDYSSDTSTDSSSSESSVSGPSTPRVYRGKRASRSTSSSASSAPKKSKKKRSESAKRKKNESRSRSRSPKSKPSSPSERKKTTRRTSSSPSPTPKKKAHDLKRKRSESSSHSRSPERKTNAHCSRRGKKDRKIKKGKDKSPSRDHSRVDSPHRKKKNYQSRSPEHDRSCSQSPHHKSHKKKQKKREQSRSPSRDRSPRHFRRSRSRSPRYPARPVITQHDRQLREPSNEIVVFNVPKSCTAKELHEIFKEFGPIEEVNVIRDRFTGQSRGFAFITFEELESAKRTIEKIVDSMEIDGRRLQCNYSWGQNRPPDAEQHQHGTRKKW